jgi:hypothetical protein
MENNFTPRRSNPKCPKMISRNAKKKILITQTITPKKEVEFVQLKIPSFK